MANKIKMTNSQRLNKLFNILNNPKQAKSQWKKLGYKEPYNKTNFDKELDNVSWHATNTIKPKQAQRLLRVVGKYDLKPIKQQKPTNKDYNYNMSLVEFKIQAITDAIIGINNKQSTALAMASHSANSGFGYQLDADQHILEPKQLYVYDGKKKSSNIATYQDIANEYQKIMKTLAKIA